MTRYRWPFFLKAAALSSLLFLASCMTAAEMILGGPTNLRMEFEFHAKASEIFPDPEVRRMAQAACTGDRRSVERLAAAGVDPNARGKNGYPPLFWAVHCRNVEGIRALIEAGADPNQHDDFFVAPVLAAASIQDMRFLEAMLQHGGDPGYSMIHAAHKQGVTLSPDAGERYENEYLRDYEMDAESVFEKSLSWDTHNRGYDDDRHLNLLLRYGLDPDASDNPDAPEWEQRTALLIVIGHRRYCTAVELLERGASVNLARALGQLQFELGQNTGPDVGPRARHFECSGPLKAMLEARVSPEAMEEHRVNLQLLRQRSY